MMGTSQSKNSPDAQMRRKMEDGFEGDDDDDIDLGISNRGGGDRTRSKSNLSFHTSDRINQNEDEDYFNRIYSKRAEKSLNSLTGSSLGVKSAPAGSKKEKDPEVAAAIAELEETFKVLGDNNADLKDSSGGGDNGPQVNPEIRNNGGSGNVKIRSDSSKVQIGNDSSSYPNSANSEGKGENSEGVISITQISNDLDQIPYDRHLTSRAGTGEWYNSDDTADPSTYLRRATSKRLNGSVTDSSSSSSGLGYSPFNSSSSGSSSILPKSRGGTEMRSFLISSHSNIPNSRAARLHTQSQQSLLMQQKKEFQHQRSRQSTTEGLNKNPASQTVRSNGETNENDWNYEPPKIDGFDINKFKEINSKVAASTIVPIIMREDEEDKGYYSRSPDIPAYTKDELELIASLEREVY